MGLIQHPLRILICDDYEFARTGLAHTLAREADIHVVGEAANGAEAVKLCQTLQPDIVLMDIGMPVMDGITATLEIKKAMPQVKVIILSGRENRIEILDGISAGASAYCRKDIPTERLARLMTLISDGVLWLDPSIASVVVDTIQHHHVKTQDPGTKQQLTTRELEVLQCIVAGKGNKQIATELKLSIYTVKSHVRSLLQKLGTEDRTQLALKAVQEHLLPLELVPRN